MTHQPGRFTLSTDGDAVEIVFEGRWDLATVARLDAELRGLEAIAAKRASLRLGSIEALDTAGAWALHRLRAALAARGMEVAYDGADEARAALLHRLETAPRPAPLAMRSEPPFVALLARLGSGATRAISEALDIVGFFGLVVGRLARLPRKRGRIRLVPVVAHIERTGLNAMPIVGLLSFLVGLVLAYQGVDQLRNFGAETFMVNLAGISILREIGVLMTAIVVAGRSGSAFTAQIGTMRVREEVDALRTLGLDPIEVLVIPRILALTFVMPFLAFYADIVGLFGAAFAAMILLDMSPYQFVSQLRQAVAIEHFWVGIVKAPVFGFLIALVGCRYGLKVKGSAENVGRRTTQSVVESIFLVIVVDAVFSIVFSRLEV